MFLFFVPLILVLVAGLGFLANRVSSTDVAKQAGLTGGLAQQIDSALRQSSRARWLALGSGLLGLAIAGRTLARTLSIASRRAWRCPASRPVRSTTRVAGLLAGMVAGGGLIAIGVNRVRQATGVLVAGSTALPVAAFAYGAAWVVISSALPRGDTDRTALLPGAVFVGVTLTATQLVLQLAVPSQLSRASALYGSIGFVIVALSWFFIVGRMFVISFEIDAVLWERFGSPAGWVLRWPPLRSWVLRRPHLRRHFDRALGTDEERVVPGTGDTPSTGRREHRTGDDGGDTQVRGVR